MSAFFLTKVLYTFKVSRGSWDSCDNMILSNDNMLCNNNDDDADDVNNISKCELLVVLPKLDIDYSFDGKLRRLQREYHW